MDLQWQMPCFAPASFYTGRYLLRIPMMHFARALRRTLPTRNQLHGKVTPDQTLHPYNTLR